MRLGWYFIINQISFPGRSTNRTCIMGGGGVLTQKIPVATPKSVNWDWVFCDFLGFFKFPNWDWVFLGFLGLGFFGFLNFQIGIAFFWDWDFLGFLNFQIGIGFFWDWDFLGFFGFSLYFLNLKLVLVFFCFLTIIYGNIHNKVLASA